MKLNIHRPNGTQEMIEYASVEWPLSHCPLCSDPLPDWEVVYDHWYGKGKPVETRECENCLEFRETRIQGEP